MPATSYHVAQLNIGRVRAPVDDPLMADFTNNLVAINTLGHNTSGFVWQLLTDDGDSTAFRMFPDEDNLLINMTVWESIDALFDFTYKSQHVEFVRRRREWFEPMRDLPTLVLWWVPAGHQPTLEEAKAKLLYLRQHGPTPLAFTFQQRYMWSRTCWRTCGHSRGVNRHFFTLFGCFERYNECRWHSCDEDR